MGFKIGEKVVCIKECNKCIYTKRQTPGPKKDDILIIYSICNDGWLSFEEYPKHYEYEPWNYRKLHYEFVEEVLSMIKEESLIEV